MASNIASLKIPESVLIIIYTLRLDVLLIERTDHHGFWQSVTGSKDTPVEPLLVTAQREVEEETGIIATSTQIHDWCLWNVYDIYPAWRHRYATGVTSSTEHVFGLCLPDRCIVRLNPQEHTAFQWLAHQHAAEMCFSPSNAEAILLLPRFMNLID